MRHGLVPTYAACVAFGVIIVSAPAMTAAHTAAGCRDAVAPEGRSVVSVTSGGVERSYVLYVPPTLDAHEPAPLVMDFPAYSPASLEEAISGFTKPDSAGRVWADDFGAIVVTPEPVNGAGALLTWNYVGTDGWTDDQGFVDDVLDDVATRACVDLDRVLASGFAVGGVFASIYTCTHADRIAALATVAGLYSPAECDPSEPVPVVSFHGTADRFIAFDGGIGSGPADLGLTPETIAGLVFMAERPGAIESSVAWAGHNGCGDVPDVGPAGEGLTSHVWTGCEGGGDVELYVIEGGEHTWPGSNGMDGLEGLLGPVSDAVNANDVIGEFFLAHAPA